MVKKIYCAKCNREMEETRKRNARAEELRCHHRGLVWGIVAGVLALIACAITLIVHPFPDSAWGIMIPSWIFFVIGVWTLVSEVIWDEGFVADMFFAGFRSFRMPGIIFTWDLDGIIALIAIKLTLSILSIILSIAWFFLVTAFSMLCAIFCYPFHMIKHTDGKETYKYTIGNIKDGSVYEISRKGSNKATKLEGITADSQYALMTDSFKFSAEEIDSIRSETSGDTTVYTINLNKTGTLAIQQKICDYINSNTEQGVIKVDNYFNSSSYLVVTGEIIVEYNKSDLVSIKAATELQYTPTSGEYTDREITLNNELSLEINKNADKAAKYEAPSSEGNIIGLGAATNYIL